MVIYLLWSFTNRVFKDCTDLGGFVGRAFAFDTRVPWFKSSCWQTFKWNTCKEKTLIKKKAVNGPIKKQLKHCMYLESRNKC